jgi:major vault protein
MNSRQWAVIHNPVDKNTGKNALGTAKLLRGEASFFLQPGEVLNPGPENVYVLEEQHALSVLAVESFEEELEDRQGRKTRVRRNAGDRWLVYGPKEFWPPLEVEVQKRVHAFFGIEALHFYLFRPDAAIVTAISVLVLLLAFLILRL